VQQGRVVGVLDVLLHQLPVGGDVLAVVAEHLELPAAVDAAEVLEEFLAEIVAERRRCVRKGRPDDAVHHLGPQRVQAVRLGVEIRRHAALPTHPTAERHAEQPPIERVGPLVVGAGELLGMAKPRLAELHAAMAAAVFHDGDGLGRTADHDHRTFAEYGGFPVPDRGQLGFEADIEPMRAVPDLFQLAEVDVGV